MDLGKTVSYGMIAMGYIAKQAEGYWVTSEELAQKFDMPKEFLQKIMNQYVRTGITAG